MAKRVLKRARSEAVPGMMEEHFILAASEREAAFIQRMGGSESRYLAKLRLERAKKGPIAEGLMPGTLGPLERALRERVAALGMLVEAEYPTDETSLSTNEEE